jgi:tRNA nucleotidyltransferase/poly(A) polymerase
MAGLVSTFEDAARVVAELRAGGHVAYLAGGCVRDRLLGLVAADQDVATDAPPERVQQLFRRTQAVGAVFGVVLVHVGRSVVEVATFRADGKYEDGRRPGSVRFTDAREDARRRDFTINAMFYDPVADEVIDYVGGREDLKSRVLRAVGVAQERFEEDQLRLLRAVRFAARFGLTIEADTAAAIRRCAAKLPRIAPERIADELRRMWTATTRQRAIELLRELHLSQQVFRLIDAPEVGGGKIFGHVAPGEAISFGLALAGAILDEQHEAGMDLRVRMCEVEVGKSVGAMRKTLRLSNDETQRCQDVLLWAGVMLADAVPTVARMKRMLATEASGDVRRMLAGLRAAGLFTERVGWLEKELARLEATECAPAAFVNGDDLAGMGLAPGPRYKQVLAEVYDAQLEGRVGTREEGLEMARGMVG